MGDAALLPAAAPTSASGEYAYDYSFEDSAWAPSPSDYSFDSEGAWAPSPSGYYWDYVVYGEVADGPAGVHCGSFVRTFGKR